ncbi:Bax inhibitor-1/YccA family protein [Parvularcula flava]|uniref:Bax inhibitor-1/YccA family protein n=1 Tax=Aquisalinus luteolus TaxID=1566827 RepID=A0A8J3A4G7_9PROT|nr:Bax inhibitor-1/YccA family protein [Aquisalinus luteolus]NHK29411.1 Bax inhibitor-1/YccA family protein [Aquisalinus luteolus]GGI02029.1 membrane protein [Aquisalinus luteolus]
MNDFNQYSSTTRTGEGLAVDEGLRSYMLGVYNYMGLGLAGTALIAMLFVANPTLSEVIGGLSFIPFIALIGVGWFGSRMIFTSGSRAVAHGIYWLYVALWAVLIGPMVAAYVSAGLAEMVYQAFFITAAMFGATSLFGYTTKRDMSGWGGVLMMIGIGLLIAIVINFFFASTLMSLLISFAVVIFTAVVTAFETQMIKNLYREGAGEANARASIFGAFALYGSFVTMFIHILNILGIMRE